MFCQWPRRDARSVAIAAKILNGPALHIVLFTHSGYLTLGTELIHVVVEGLELEEWSSAKVGRFKVQVASAQKYAILAILRILQT